MAIGNAERTDEDEEEFVDYLDEHCTMVYPSDLTKEDISEMIDMVLDHVIAEQRHPFQVIALHVAAPFADQLRCDVLGIDICPCIVPVVVEERLFGEVLVEPCLCVNGRAVIVR